MSKELFLNRRYLSAFNTRNLPQKFTDCLVIGCGIAGLRAAIEAEKYGQVILLNKRGAFESNTAYAQGGVAVVFKNDRDDNPDLHIADTLKVGCGLNDVEAVRVVITEGPKRVSELMGMGAKFDAQGGELDFGREAGHSASRIIHAKGDATGKEIVRALNEHVKICSNISVFDDHFTVDLIVENNTCLGAIVFNDLIGLHVIWSKQTILATGGCGRVYQETTNPEIATGDGFGMAWRAGAELSDMEMIQFHPTTLYIAGASRALISEAVRGEGAYLVDKNGVRFMADYHPDMELAPRDVVSLAIMSHMQKTNSRYVFLDCRHIPEHVFSKRFPYITEVCRSFDIEPSKNLIPVRPSAHYMIGGVRSDLNARTSVHGLYACGEVACSGLHGANRLASNSLLEGLVFGAIAGQHAGEWISNHPDPIQPVGVISSKHAETDMKILDIQDMRTSLRSIMWRLVGIRRTHESLAEAVEAMEFWASYVLNKNFDRPLGWEAQNMLMVSWIMANSALLRTESRGVHYREDFSKIDNEHWRKHIIQICKKEGQ
jgi:L-aspartate oxidase